MKIVFVAPRYHTNQHGWVKALKDAGHEVHYFVSEENPTTENRSALEPEVVPNNPLPKIFTFLIDFYVRITGRVIRKDFHSLPSKFWFIKRLQTIKPDVVIVRHSTYPLSLCAFIAANQLMLKTILYNQDPLDANYNFSTRVLQRLGVVPRLRITPFRKNKNSDYNPRTNSHYVPLIIDSNKLKGVRHQTFEGPIKFIFVGKYNMPRKKHRLMLEVFAALHSESPVKLTMIGFMTPDALEYFSSLKKLVQSLGISKDVNFLTNLNVEEINNEYTKHDVFVLPSVNEPFAITPLEAMHHGLPVIVTDTNGARSYVTEGENGFIVKSGSHDALLNSMRHIIYASNIQEMGLAAKKMVETDYSAKKYIEYFSKALK